MNPLELLFRLQTRAILRNLWRQLKRPAGTLMAITFIALIGFAGYVSLIDGPALDAGLLAAFLPPGLLALFLSVCQMNGFLGLNAYGPGEIDVLFPAPVSRRQLVIYEHAFDFCFLLGAALFLTFVFRGALGGLERAFLFSLIVLLIAQSLVFLLVQLINVSARLSPRLPELFRRLLLIAAVVWIVEAGAALAGVRDLLGERGGAAVAVEAIRDTTFAAAVLVPFEPVRLMADGPDWPAFLFASGFGLLIWAAFLGAGLAINADFRTVVLIQQERLERRRRFASQPGSGRGWDENKAAFPTWPLPRFRGGFGPIFWARLTQRFRGCLKRYLQWGGVLIVSVLLIQRYLFDITGFFREEIPSGWIFVGMGLYLIPYAAGNLTPCFGNRDLLKPLPARPIAVTTAEILTSTFHYWIPITAFLIPFGVWIQNPAPALWLSVLLFPALIVGGAINLSYQTTLEEPIEPQSLNGAVHILVSFFLALLGLVGATITAAAIAWTVTLFHPSAPWFGLALAWLTLAAIAVAFLPVAARSFAHPDAMQ